MRGQALNKTILAWMLTGALVAMAGGCREHMPHSATWPATGDAIPTHPKPPEGGYYTNWDPYAATIKVEPVEDVNPVKTQHVFVATVLDANGEPLPNRRVEWIIAEGSVGEFVEVDESGWRASRGYKLTNRFAVTHTNNFHHVLDRGTDDISDDIELYPGQTWAVVTSPIEGTTHLIAYAPGIYDWDKHKVFVKKHWFDVEWDFPPDAVNPTGTDHVMSTQVRRISDGMPLDGYVVTYKIVGGPSAVFAATGTDTASVFTDNAGVATVTMRQVAPTAGRNDIQIDIVRPDDEKCCKPGAHITTGVVSKTWIAPNIAITKDAPRTAGVNEDFEYRIVVSNPSSVDAQNVMVRDTLPAGIEYVSSSPRADVSGQMLSWSLGGLAGGASQQIAVRVRANQTGVFNNCAEVSADQGLSDRDCAETVVTAPQLDLEMSCTGQIILCDSASYQVIVHNRGDGTATNAMVNIQLPNGVMTDQGRTQLTFAAGNLGPGQSKKADFNIKADRAGTYRVHATATADGGLTADASCETSVSQPVLSVVKRGPDRRFLGRPADYQITVTNEGDTPASDTVLTDTIPAGLRALEASDGGQISGSAITWRLGTLAPGASKTVTARFEATQKGSLSNTATARAYCAEASASATMVVEGIPAILLEVVDLNDPIEVGTNTTYEIQVLNQGSSDGTNISITCTLPAEMEFISAQGPTAHAASGKTVTFDPLPSLSPKAKATYRLTVKGTAPNDVRFKVTLTSDQAQVPVEETESTHVY